jgi:hypothetical protein
MAAISVIRNWAFQSDIGEQYVGLEVFYFEIGFDLISTFYFFETSEYPISNIPISIVQGSLYMRRCRKKAPFFSVEAKLNETKAKLFSLRLEKGFFCLFRFEAKQQISDAKQSEESDEANQMERKKSHQ